MTAMVKQKVMANYKPKVGSKLTAGLRARVGLTVMADSRPMAN